MSVKSQYLPNVSARRQMNFRYKITGLQAKISAPMRLVPLGEGDFSTLWRLCIESPSQPKLASSLHNKRLSYWRLTGFGRNDNEAG